MKRHRVFSLFLLAVLVTSLGALAAESPQGNNLPQGKARGWKLGKTISAQLGLFSPLEPVAFWSFNRCAMDGDVILDSSPSKADLTLDRAFCVSGKYGLGARFNGIDSIGETDPAILNFSNKLTISAWVYPETVEGPQTIINKWYYYDSYMLSIQDGYFAFTVAFLGGPWGTTYGAAAPATPGVWTHVAGVFDGENHRATLYLNGQQRTQTFTSNHRNLQQSMRPVAVGSHPSWNALRGKIDEVAMYDAALTGDQIRALAGMDVGPYHGADSNVHPETGKTGAYPVGAENGYDFYGGALGEDTRPCNMQDFFHYKYKDVITGLPVAPPVCRAFSYEAANIARPERTYGFWHLKGPQHDFADSYGSPREFGEAQAAAFLTQWRRYRHIVGGHTLFADVERDIEPPDDSGWEVCVQPLTGSINAGACERNGEVLEGFLEYVTNQAIDITPGVYTRPNIWREFLAEEFIPMNGVGEKLPFVLWLTGCGARDSAVVRTPEEIAAGLAIVKESALGGMKPVLWQHQLNHPADYDAITQNPSGKFVPVPSDEVFVLRCP